MSTNKELGHDAAEPRSRDFPKTATEFEARFATEEDCRAYCAFRCNRRKTAGVGQIAAQAFSNSLKSQEMPCGKTLINPQLLKIRAKHAGVAPQIPAPAAR